jgi:putative transposase
MPKKVCIRLSPHKRRSLQRLYKVEKRPKMRERYQMLLLSDSGKGIGEVAEIVSRSIWTVSDIIHAYAKEGLAGIQLKPQPGNHRKLTKEQRKEIAVALKKSPRSHSLPSAFWNVHWVRTLIKERFSIIYRSENSYRALLYESGFSFHRPEKKYREQDPKVVRKWLVDAKKN